MESILRSVLGTYWRDARGTSLLVLLATLVGALAAIAAPDLFSRAVDRLAAGSDASGALRILLRYALLLGIAATFGQAARFLVFLCAKQLAFIANAAFFARLLQDSGLLPRPQRGRHRQRPARGHRISPVRASDQVVELTPHDARAPIPAFS